MARFTGEVVLTAGPENTEVRRMLGTNAVRSVAKSVRRLGREGVPTGTRCARRC